jgi:uncharacterized protein
MEYHAFNLDNKSLTETGQIEGLASGYGNVDSDGDIIAPGTFAASIGTQKAAGRSPAMLLHHDMKRPIGRWDSFTETDAGLVAKGKLSMDVTDAREAYSLLRDKALTGLSVGFNGSKSAGRTAAGGRLITQASLHEVSLVTFPANPIARVSSVKSIGSVRDLEDLLQDAGMSGRKAKAAASAAWRSINGNDETAAIEAKLADLLTTANASFAQFKKG